MSDRANRRPDGPPVSASGRRHRRVRVIVGLFVVAVVAAALVGWQFARESTPVSGPILLVSIDPLRVDRLGVYGGHGPATPHLDQLADDAIVFTHGYAHSASSLPAHLSLLTGQLPFEHGVRDDVGFQLDAGAETLASRLASRGPASTAAFRTSTPSVPPLPPPLSRLRRRSCATAPRRRKRRSRGSTRSHRRACSMRCS
jgi:hypothetical protein